MDRRDSSIRDVSAGHPSVSPAAHAWWNASSTGAATATINRIRGLLSEFGIVLPLKAEVVRTQARNHLEDLPGYVNTVIGDLLSASNP